jgi:AcrR family transcriptional regulator
VETSVKLLRSDARRNRDAMIDAARQVFAEHGVDAPLDLIAKTAGVGRATQHRHFPTREGLLVAIFEDNLEQLAEIACDAEPEQAYVKLLLATVEIVFRDRGFMELLDRRVPLEAQQDMARRYIEMTSEPLRLAQEAGSVRQDLEPEDTLLLVDMLGGVAQPSGRTRPSYRMERALKIVLAAIEPDEDTGGAEAVGRPTTKRKRAA